MSRPETRWCTLAEGPADLPAAEAAPPIDAWLDELGLAVVGRGAAPEEQALSRDVILDGERRFDLRVTIAWAAGMGLHLWGYYGPEAMELPRRTLLRLLSANAEYPFVKFAVTEEDRPMIIAELPPDAVGRDELGRALARIVVVADRLLEETAPAIVERGKLPDWTGRIGRNPDLLKRFGADVEAAMPEWHAPSESSR
ncbi:MAG: hypothetical protein ACRDFZ_05160 [Candidatus Limnocylindria bacterium]